MGRPLKPVQERGEVVVNPWHPSSIVRQAEWRSLVGHCSLDLPRCFAGRLFLYIHGSLMAQPVQSEPHRLDTSNPPQKKAGKSRAEPAHKTVSSSRLVI